MMDKPQHDAVKYPAHYTKWAIQPRDFANANNLGFWQGNTIKYILRAGDKVYDGLTAHESEVRDLEKAIETVEDRLRHVHKNK